jgi:carboxyl-terminal processing protease
MLFRLLFTFLLFFGIMEAKPPQIGPKDVRKKVEEILKAHASFKRLTPEIMERTLENFIEELDPGKTYFLSHEIEPWINPTQEIVQIGLNGFKNADFSLFQDIHETFLSAIERRSALESKIDQEELPTDVKSEEFKEPLYAETIKDLETKLLRIRALQLEAADRVTEDTRGKFVKRLKKRRHNREAEFTGINKEDRYKVTLACVLKSVSSALDSHTNYFTPSEANQFMIQVQQRLFGIGAQLKDNLDGLSIVRILDNSPASKSQKLKINDKIIGVNGETIVGMDIIEAVDLIRGEKGTPVTLKLIRESGEGNEKHIELIETELIRGEVVLEETRLESSFEPYGDGVIAVFRLFSFYQDRKSSSSGDIKKAFENIKKDQTIKGVLLDLRGNAGGLLAQAVSVAGLFINKGIVCSIKDNTGKVQHLRELDGKPIWDGPLFVLTNRASASAAEIVAQSLQDYGRSLVIGDDRTFGKGSFQTFTLDPVHNPKVNPEGEYKVTRGRYYTVSGKSPKLKADIIVPGLLSNLDIGEQFAKFPLENDEIEPHFEDDLSDISPFHRLQLGPMYKYNLQTRLSVFEPYTETLRKNAKLRIQNNKNYQNFLTELDKENFDASSIDLFGQSDLQLVESFNIMKDLIFLMNQNQSQ